MVPALGEGGGVIVAGAADGGEGLIGVDVHAADGVDDADKARKVDADVVAHVHTVEVAQRRHAGLDAVESGVGQLVLAFRAREVNVVVAGGVDEGRLLGDGVDDREDVHVAAGIFGQLTAVVHAAEVDHERLFGDLVGLCAGEQAGGDIVQGREALLCPDAAHSQRSAKHDGQNPCYDRTGAGSKALAHQQPEQHQQRRDDDEIEHRQHLGAPELHQRGKAQDGLQSQQDHSSFRELIGRRSGLTGVQRLPLFMGRDGRLRRFRRKPGLRLRRRCGTGGPGRLRGEEVGAVHLDLVRLAALDAPMDMPGAFVVVLGMGMLVFVKHRRSLLWMRMPSGGGEDGQHRPRGQAGGRLVFFAQPAEGLADMVRAGRVHKAGRAVLNADVDGEIAGVHIIVGVRFEGKGQLGVGVAIDQLGTEWGTGLAGPAHQQQRGGGRQNDGGKDQI